jgi:NAD(P)-dependent dehydrogenase (short-subunit alcohol dehydrogenase family)
MSQRKIALVTGANRGLGLEVSRELARKGLHVLLGTRDPAKGIRAAEELRREGLEVQPIELDTSSEPGIRACVEEIRATHGRLDVLVNNAGILPDSGGAVGGGFPSAFEVPREVLEAAFRTNTLGPYLLCQAVIPMMRKQGYGRVVNVSSGMGQLSEMEGGWPGYRLSKTALNAVTRIFAAETGEGDVLINSVCPGWVKTDMGGSGAERSLPEGADTIVWLATLPQGGPTGGFFRDREPIDW